MNILQQKYLFFNRASRHVPRQLEKLFFFGCSAFALRNVASVRGNARTCAANYHTAKTKAWRLTRNPRWSAVFPRLLGELGAVTAASRVAVDFSSFGPFQVLTFAVQTRLGRALPVYFEIITYPITKDSQNLFIISAIERFASAVSCRPMLVMDRGFACPSIIRHLADQSHLFVIRVKGAKQFRNWQNRLFKARNTGKNDQLVRGYGRRLRLVVSDRPGNGNEPWYLVTNDPAAARDRIVAEYYHRFEIEEFFKDAKWLQGLERLRMKTTRGMTAVMWFVLLGWWCMAFLQEHAPVAQGSHAHDRLSVPRLVMEVLLREQHAVVRQHMTVCMSGGKEVMGT